MSLAGIFLRCIAFSEGLTWRELWIEVGNSPAGMWELDPPSIILRRIASGLVLSLDSDELATFQTFNLPKGHYKWIVKIRL